MFQVDELEDGELVYFVLDGKMPKRGDLPWTTHKPRGGGVWFSHKWMTGTLNGGGTTVNPFKMTDGTWAISVNTVRHILMHGPNPYARVTFIPVDLMAGIGKSYRLSWGMGLHELH